jgi:hypothetical protein
MKTGSYEIINDHRYWVVRDEKGHILELSGADIFIPPVVDPIIEEARAIVSKENPELVEADRDKLLIFITKKLLQSR